MYLVWNSGGAQETNYIGHGTNENIISIPIQMLSIVLPRRGGWDDNGAIDDSTTTDAADGSQSIDGTQSADGTQAANGTQTTRTETVERNIFEPMQTR